MNRPQNDKNKLIKAILSTLHQNLRSYQEGLFRFYELQHKYFVENYEKNDIFKQESAEQIEISRSLAEDLNKKAGVLTEIVEVDQEKLLKLEKGLKVELSHDGDMQDLLQFNTKFSSELEKQVSILNKYKEMTGMEISVMSQGFRVNFRYIDYIRPESEYWVELVVDQGRLVVQKQSHWFETSQKLSKTLEDTQNLLVYLKALRSGFKSLNR